jgi:glycosyltransferase involved in cell wall biosynthesis
VDGFSWGLVERLPINPGVEFGPENSRFDKTPAFLYMFLYETALQNDLSGRVPQSPEKRFPINQLASAIESLLQNPEKIKEMSRKDREVVLSEFSMQRMADQIISAYQGVL